jgi:iron complex transport system substrate-binding protein
LNGFFLIACLAVAIFLALLPFQNHFIFAGSATRTFTDMLGRSVAVPEPLTRVALLGGPTGQIVYILGARSQLCAGTKSIKASKLISLMDPSIESLPTPRSTNGQINVEELIVADPQLVIAGDFDGSIVEKKTRIPVAYFDSDMGQSFEQMKEEMQFYGKVFQKESRAEKYNRYLQETIDRIQARTRNVPKNKRKIVFNGYSSNHLVTLGGDTFMQQHMELAGCLNAAKSISTTGTKEGLHTGLAEVSMEKVLEWNPDVLIIDFGTPEELFNDARWGSISAVKNGKVYKQPIGIFIWDRPTAESAVLHPLWLAKVVYPDLFADIDLAQEIKRFYRLIMSFDLTDEHVVAILTAKYAMIF